MGLELPAINAVIARLVNPEINLAAFGGIMYPLALIIESPIIMLLAASTALCKDWASYRKLRRFMLAAGAGLTVLHVLIAFTPLYYVIARQVLGVPNEIIAPARVGLMIMVPWTWAIAYRRFHQGLLIRFGRSMAISYGTLIRLCTDLVVLGIGYRLKDIPGTVVAGCAITAGVVAEAIYAGLVARPVIHQQLKLAPALENPITLRTFIAFYLPLVMTSLISFLVQPIGSAALSRMPQPIDSLATWSVVSALVFMFRSFGLAYNEVVVALLDHAHSTKKLWHFAVTMMLSTTLIWVLIISTPLSHFWFQTVSALSRDLAFLAQLGIWITLPLPALAVLQSWYQGAILHSRDTYGITEAVGVFLCVNILILLIGIGLGQIIGLYVGLISFVISTIVQTVWLRFRSRAAFQKVHLRDELTISFPPAEIIP